MTKKSCAACKFQRRKCPEGCVLAPYFPISRSKEFKNVHRLFGVSKVSNVLKCLNTQHKRDEFMTSVIYEADMRDRFRVHGCIAVIASLASQLKAGVQALMRVQTQIEICRKRMGLDKQIQPMIHGSGQGTNHASSSNVMDPGTGHPGTISEFGLDPNPIEWDEEEMDKVLSELNKDDEFWKWSPKI